MSKIVEKKEYAKPEGEVSAKVESGLIMTSGWGSDPAKGNNIGWDDGTAGWKDDDDFGW